MIKKITMLIFLMLLSVTISLGQMASLDNQTAYPNMTTDVAINVESLSNINSITFYIEFNPDVLDYIGLIEPALPGMFAHVTGSVVNITWFSATSYSPLASVPLCKLKFLYKGTYSPLNFLPGCEVTHGAIPFLVGYLNGSVSQATTCNPTDPHAVIGSVSGAPGDILNIPVDFSNFPDVGSFTQYIHYDPSKLTFISISTGGSLVGTIYNNSNGVITISWTTPALFPNGRNINTILPNMMKINFECNFPGNSILEFGPGGVFTTGNPLFTNIGVCYSNGNITQTPTINTAILGSLTGVIQGEEIKVPLDLNISSSISAFTLYLHCDSPVLTFTGIEIVDPLSSLVMANVSGDIVTLVYTNVSPVVISSGTFLKIKYNYNGIGTGFVNFVGMSQFTDNFLMPINVTYSNSTIAPGVYPPNATATIGSVSAIVNTVVDVPIEIDGTSANPLGAVTMFIGYDQSKLSFIGAIDNVNNATVNFTDNQISIAWEDASGVNFIGNFLKLRFQYHGGGGNGCGSSIYFMNDNITLQPCELANNLALFVPANWVNGGVNLNPVQPIINGPSNPNVNSLNVGYSTDAGMINYDWSVTGGSIVSGQGTPSISVNWGSAGAGAVLINYFTDGGCYLSAIKPIMVIAGSPITNIEGYITYDNNISQGMNGVNLTLYNSLGEQVGTPVTTSTNSEHGYYSFTGVPQDSYTLIASLSAAWAGVPYVSATDALLDELHTAGILNPLLSGIRYSAANVNGGSSVNATDALFIKKRIIGEISSFPVGDWVFNNGVISAFTSPVTTYNFKGLCTGDVNGSYNPVVGVKTSGSLDITDVGIQTELVNKSFTYNITSGVKTQLGAISLYLTYDSELIEVEKISSNFKGFESNIKNGMVVLVWSDPKGKILNIEDVIVSFQIKAKKMITNPTTILSIQTGSEFADSQANILNSFTINMSRVVTNDNEFMFNVYPNPFHNSTNILYSLTEEGRVKFSITNLMGKQICVVVDEIVSSGNHVVSLNANQYNMDSGIYLGKLEVETVNGKISNIKKIVLIN